MSLPMFSAFSSVFVAAGALVACSSGSPSSGVASSPDAGDAAVNSNPLGCAIGSSDGCPVYYCGCQRGPASEKVPSNQAVGCGAPEAVCANFCEHQFPASPAAEFRCGKDSRPPPPVDAGLPRASAGGPCLAGDVCSERDFASCADLTVQLMRSACPASGVCPTYAQAEAAACASHGGPQRI